jgi:hypothetical protein
MRIFIAFIAALFVISSSAYQISVGTYVVNANRTVTVPIALDSAAGLSYAGASLTYDPQILVVTKVEAGTLKTIMPEDFISSSTNGLVNVAIFGSTATNIVNGAGTIANVTFAIRAGTEGSYSDIIVSNIDIGEYTGVKDVTVGNPVKTVNGMVRVMRTDAAVQRLEGEQTVVADTMLGSVKLEAGDAIQASDAQTPITVSGLVSAASPIRVAAPVNGWASGTYALLSTKTTGLTFALDGVEGIVTSETRNDITTYYAAIAIAGEVFVDCADETLTAGAKNLIRENARLAFAGKTDAASLAMKDAFEKAKKISVSGPAGLVSVIADMGISPAFAPLDETGTLKLTYAKPSLAITSFDATTGAVRFKVTPGEGNAIVSEIATGYVHVYGTDNLGEKMRYISKVGFDLTPYLKDESKGEGVLNVTLGRYTFLKIKIESVMKNEGEME